MKTQVQVCRLVCAGKATPWVVDDPRHAAIVAKQRWQASSKVVVVENRDATPLELAAHRLRLLGHRFYTDAQEALRHEEAQRQRLATRTAAALRMRDVSESYRESLRRHKAALPEGAR